MRSLLLLPFRLLSTPPTTYPELKASIVQRRTDLGSAYTRSTRKDTVITSARAYLLTAIDAQFEHWKGTPWDFSAQQQLPGNFWPRGGRVSQVFNPSWKGGAERTAIAFEGRIN